MGIYQYLDAIPQIGEKCYIAESAELIGNVVIGDNCYIGPKAVIRADYGKIVIGANSSVEEGVLMHARPGELCETGQWVTLGHGCIVHGARIHDYAVIGMGAIASDFCDIGVWAAIGEGAVVRSKQKIPEGAIAVGIPAKVIGETSPEYRRQWEFFKANYVELAENYASRLKKIG